MKRVGDIGNLLEVLESTSRLGNYTWKLVLELPDGSGEGYVRNGRLIYLKVKDEVGEQAFKLLTKYDRILYSVEISNENPPEIHQIDYYEILTDEVKVKYRGKVETFSGRFLDLLKSCESESFTGMVFFNDINNNPTLGIFQGGLLCGLRYFSSVGFKNIEKNREHNTNFYLAEFKDVFYVAGYIYGLKSQVDVPASQWKLEDVARFKGVVEITKGLEKFLMVSDGDEILIFFKLGVPPNFELSQAVMLFRRGNLLSTYPAQETSRVFRYSFAEVEVISKVFSLLISNTRNLIGEVVFKRAYERILKESISEDLYPDEFVERLKEKYSLYEKEVANFMGKRWSKVKESLLSNYPEKISDIFRMSSR